LGHDEYGHPQFETKRTELGELLYQLKYRHDRGAVVPLVRSASEFLRLWRPGVDLLVPVPPSRPRATQPLFEICEGLGRELGLPVDQTSIRKVLEHPELKGLYDYSQRLEALEGAHELDLGAFHGRRVLLMDDLYRSGATLNAVARLVRDQGGATAVLVLTLTRTRSSS